MRWIGLTGRAGAGKDFTYKALRSMHFNCYRVSFADQLRDEIYETLGVRIEKPYSELERSLQQWWGTDFRRKNNPNYWVERAETAALLLPDRVTPIFTDVRFPNEAEMIKENGGIIVRVQASPEARAFRLGQLPPEHESETAMDAYPVDMYVTSMAENPAYDGQVRRILVAASVDDVVERIQYALDRD